MSKVLLLENLKEFTERAVCELLLPVQMDEEDDLPPPPRAAAVYIPRLPELRSYAKKAPFITHEIVTGKDNFGQYPNGGRFYQSSAVVRSCFCVFHDNEQEGGLALLNLMEAVRVPLLERCTLGSGQFRLDVDAGVETLVYPVNPNQVASSPFYLGEMIATWQLPPVKRLDAARIAGGMPPWDPRPRHLEETIRLKGSDPNGKEND